MAKLRVPYLEARPRAGGRTVWMWNPGPALRQAGHKPRLLGEDRAAAVAAAMAINREIQAGAAADAPPAHRLYSVADLVRDYRGSAEWDRLSARTRIEYARHLDALLAWTTRPADDGRMASAPVRAITRDLVLTRWEARRRETPAMADAWLRVCRLLWAWGAHRSKPDCVDLLAKPRMGAAKRRAVFWSTEQLAAFIAHAEAAGEPGMALAALLGFWTSQRQGDVLRLRWRDLEGGALRIEQSKTGAKVAISLGRPLRAALDAVDRRGLFVVTMADGRPWTGDAFRKRFAELRDAAGLPAALQWRDLRRTCVVHLARAGATVPEIAAVTGHAIDYVQSILAHYLPRDGAVAAAAITKLEASLLAGWERDETGTADADEPRTARAKSPPVDF